MIRRPPQPMTCKELVELVTDYLEGNLTRSETARFQRHLDGCDGCTTYVEQFRQTIKLTGSLHEEHIDPEARRELLSAFRDWSST
jgi:anti-sigma factor RsiW